VRGSTADSALWWRMRHTERRISRPLMMKLADPELRRNVSQSQ
jgi:hypothetical protein